MDRFHIPVVVFLFKRTEKTLLLMNTLARVRPRKLYLISDGPRNESEAAVVAECRQRVEERIDWPCEIVKDYADVNRGVFDRIGLGAQRVLRHEASAIFLEDDNLPELSFFPFCAEMLDRYRNDSRVLWVCGSNYLREYEPADGSSYVFTRHLLPCGWASWGHKFEKYYESDLSLLHDEYIVERIRLENPNKALFRQDMRNWVRERRRIVNTGRANSWDYQMGFTLRAHGLYGIVPKFNQITNIGVDEHSIHGGTTFENIMTRRFCGVATRPLTFPLRHPRIVCSDVSFERRLGRIILFPVRYRLKGFMNRLIKFLARIPDEKSLSGEIRKHLRI